ncbi:MAG TPA: hypothetical protein VGM37_05375 [Armatimonadota bacterium]|jgi:hypothetical protein
MARVTVDPECADEVRRVRRLIRERLGVEAATVFGEAMANVREHGADARAELRLHGAGFEVHNMARGSFHRETDKPSGEGGYGLSIMERMGATLDTSRRHCCVRWRKR